MIIISTSVIMAVLSDQLVYVSQSDTYIHTV